MVKFAGAKLVEFVESLMLAEVDSKLVVNPQAYVSEPSQSELTMGPTGCCHLDQHGRISARDDNWSR